MNYTILVAPGALILLWIWWHASVKHWFIGPKRTIDLPAGMTAADEIALEHKRFHETHIYPADVVDATDDAG